MMSNWQRWQKSTKGLSAAVKSKKQKLTLKRTIKKRTIKSLTHHQASCSCFPLSLVQSLRCTNLAPYSRPRRRQCWGRQKDQSHDGDQKLDVRKLRTQLLHKKRGPRHWPTAVAPLLPALIYCNDTSINTIMEQYKHWRILINLGVSVLY